MDSSFYVQYYRKQAGGTYLPVFVGRGGGAGQIGHGWLADTWKNYIWPYVIRPIWSERVLPNLKRGAQDVYTDIRTGAAKPKEAVVRRGKETLKRVFRGHGNVKQTKKRRKR